MSNEENEIPFEIGVDFEEMGYELAGAIEFYENPETKECAYRAVMFTTKMEGELEEGEEYTDGQGMVLVTQTMLEEYLTSERH